MASTGTILPGIGENVVINAAYPDWSTPQNIQNTTSTFSLNMGPTITAVEGVVQLYNNGYIGGNLSEGVDLDSIPYVSYFRGSSTQTWGVGAGLTPALVNSSSFGVAWQAFYGGRAGLFSNAIVARDFGFSIPATATILGIEVEHNISSFLDIFAGIRTQMKYAKMEVTYSLPGNPWHTYTQMRRA